MVADALVTAGDVLDPSVREAVVSRTIERFGRIDLLINNAGAGLYAPSHMAPMEEARRMWELNFFAPLDLIQRVAPAMKRQRSGFIVNVGSIAGKMTLPWFTLYSASKYAIGSLTDGLRMELRAIRNPHDDRMSWIRQHTLPEECSARRASGALRPQPDNGQFHRNNARRISSRGSNNRSVRLSLRHRDGCLLRWNDCCRPSSTGNSNEFTCNRI